MVFTRDFAFGPFQTKWGAISGHENAFRGRPFQQFKYKDGNSLVYLVKFLGKVI